MGGNIMSRVIGNLVTSTRRFMFRVLSVGVIPSHIAFIMDGNRRYSKKLKLDEGAGHKAGFMAMTSLFKYCFELGVKYVSVYAFSIDNFKRQPHEVRYLMNLMQEKIEGFLEKESIVNQYQARVCFIGDLTLLPEPVKIAAENAMRATAHNNKIVVLICVAYTSTDEIVHAVQESCQEKCDKVRGLTVANGFSNGGGVMVEENGGVIQAMDVERHMHMVVAPDPDILIRSSGAMRLSNFLLWQTSNSVLYSPRALWPEMGLWEVVWAILNFQRNNYHLEKEKKQM